jgi:hypothetical protein
LTNGFSLANFGDLSKPATVLIDKISNAVGGYFKPYQIRRVAKAEAEAEIIKAESQIKITDLHRRALIRFVSEEAKKQDNMEKITEKSIPLLSGSSNPQNMEDDWITNFFDKCRIVSDSEMQTLWARVLAGEANTPGTFSKRTVNLLGSIDKTDAQLFTKLCGFTWIFDEAYPLIFNEQFSIYSTQEINFNTLTHLDDIGLISFGSIAGFKEIDLPQHVVTYYFGTPMTIEFNNPEKNQIEIGKALFTKTGQQLALICGAKPLDGFYDYVCDLWIKQGYKILKLE